MAVRQTTNCVGAIIQARMKSSRLPGKILLPLPHGHNGKPLLSWIVDSLKKSKQISTIILATSQEPEDDVLVDYANTNNLTLFRGSEDDVLNRFAKVIDIHHFDTIVRVTADNPIVAVREMDELIAYHILKDNDYTISENMPLGMNMEIIKGNILTSLNSRTDISAMHREHVTSFIRQSQLYKKETKGLLQENLTEKIRLTVDYPCDYALLNIATQYSLETNLTGLDLVDYIDDKNPWMWKINIDSYQVKQHSSEKEELNFAIKKMKELGLPYATSLLENAIEK